MGSNYVPFYGSRTLTWLLTKLLLFPSSLFPLWHTIVPDCALHGSFVLSLCTLILSAPLTVQLYCVDFVFQNCNTINSCTNPCIHPYFHFTICVFAYCFFSNNILDMNSLHTGFHAALLSSAGVTHYFLPFQSLHLHIIYIFPSTCACLIMHVCNVRCLDWDFHTDVHTVFEWIEENFVLSAFIKLLFKRRSK